jgi:F-type H+-transporting ATPase subunit delta
VATDDPITEGMPGRYAAALFDLATEERAVAAVETDLVTFQALLDMSPDLKAMVKSPVISRDEQAKALAAVLAKAGIGGTTANFLKLIARNGRLFAASDMIKAYKALAARARGEVGAEVTSAQPLDEAQIAELKATLKAAVGKDVQLSTRVDPSLLGGLVVKIGSRMIDSSLRTKLAGLRVALKG